MDFIYLRDFELYKNIIRLNRASGATDVINRGDLPEGVVITGFADQLRENGRKGTYFCVFSNGESTFCQYGAKSWSLSDLSLTAELKSRLIVWREFTLFYGGEVVFSTYYLHPYAEPFHWIGLFTDDEEQLEHFFLWIANILDDVKWRNRLNWSDGITS